MADSFWLGQEIVLTATLTDPANNNAPTDDPSLGFVALRQNDTQATVGTIVHVSTGIYTATVTVDQAGWWQVNDQNGGVYEFYVKPVRVPAA
jgi:hypothetical protein